jgi:DNA-binding XRE family transcriptional regulator
MVNRLTLKELHEENGPVAWFIRERRKTLGYTQEEFAVRVGVGLRFCRDIEMRRPLILTVKER